MKWMELAWAEQGVKEIEGPDSNPRILALFQRAGRGDITSDETAWCGATVAACLVGAGLPVPPLEHRLLARAYLGIGTPIAEPRVGAIVVFSRNEAGPSAGHVGFVTGWTETHVATLSGNQGNAVTVAHYERAKVLGYRWPEPPATAADLAAQGSRTIQAAKAQVRDAWLTIGSLASGFGASAVDPTSIAATGKLLGKANEVMGQAGQLQKFALFCLGSWPWMAGVAACWFLVRVLVGAGVIEAARVEDHNTGANTARSSGGAA